MSQISLVAEHREKGAEDTSKTILRDTKTRNVTASKSAEGLGRFATKKKRMRVAFGSSVNRRTPPQLMPKLDPEPAEPCEKCTCDPKQRFAEGSPNQNTRPKTAAVAEISNEIDL